MRRGSRFSTRESNNGVMLVLGDAHANEAERRAALLAAYEGSESEVALQLGDLFYYDLPVETYFIAGNNEDFDVIDALRHGRIRSSEVRNVRLLDSRVVSLEGLRIGGLSGNYAPTRYDRPRSALRDDRRRHFVREDVLDLKKQGSVDVLLTHEAPHGTPVEEEYSVGCTPIDDLIRSLSPELHLIGHHHQHSETTVGETRVITLDPVWEATYELDPATLAVTRHETPRPDTEV
ncbi:MAG: metallophosphoesterase family protein [Halodesulfurarchaeum sp.]